MRKLMEMDQDSDITIDPIETDMGGDLSNQDDSPTQD
jgi:hypothetical protein